VTEDHTNAYEGLFLFPQAQSGNLQGALDHLKDILGRARAELISLRKWDERRLAYEIKGNKRGVYFLVYFRAPASALKGIERACNLSELLLRSMVIRADHLTTDQMEAADGTAELSDEIRTRTESRSSEDAAPAEAAAPSQTTPGAGGEPDSSEPVTVETERPAQDPAPTVDR
jgi:small subunit ribosomal protein S6